MDFEKEPWRRLYKRESLEQRVWPLMARGIRDYLLRFADDDGTLLKRTTDPVEDIVRALAPTKSESKAAVDALELLLLEGYLCHDVESGRLWVTNFEEAQKPRKSREAEKKARQRARKSRDSAAEHTGAARGQQGDMSRDMSPDCVGTTGGQESTGVPPVSPSPLSVQEVAQRHIDDPTRGSLEAPLETWEPVITLLAVLGETFGSKPQKPRGGLKNPGIRAVVERLAEGYPLEQLEAAIRGSKHAEIIADKRENQTLKTILRDAGQVDKFSSMSGDKSDPSEARLRRENERAKAEPALRKALAEGKWPRGGSKIWELFSADEVEELRQQVELERQRDERRTA